MSPPSGMPVWRTLSARPCRCGGNAVSTSLPPAGVAAELAAPATISSPQSAATGAVEAQATSAPVSSPPASSTRRSPSRSAATPAA